MEHLPDDRVTIVLHTLGGCVTACVLIANALRQFRDSTAIVPYMAISGGTLIALSATRLEMGGRASLSAVDPQIMGQRVKHLAESKDKPSIAALAREYDVSMRKYVRMAPSASSCPRIAWAPPWTCSSASTRRTSGRSSGPRSRRWGSP
jgi:ClpP class serine protease